MVYLVTEIHYNEMSPLNLTEVYGKTPTVLNLGLLLEFSYSALGNNI